MSCFDSFDLSRLAFRAFPDVVENVISHPRPIVSLPYLLVSLIHTLVTTHQAVMEGFDDLILLVGCRQVRSPITDIYPDGGVFEGIYN